MSELQYNDPRQTLYDINCGFKTESLCSLLEYLCHKQKDDVFYYHPDHLGGAAWITDMNGKPIQYLHYAPYGELVANQMPYSIDERFKFTGKERDAETGYDNHDARYRWPVSGDWLSVDPLADKIIGTQPYLYCNGDPIKHVDSDGRIAIAASAVARTRLLSTLSCAERRFLSFNKHSRINIRRLNRCLSTSHNMTALKALANSKDVTYNFYVQEKSSNGQTDMKTVAGGVTEMYGAERDPSTNPSIVNIISGSHLVGEDAAENMAHEAFGHAYVYEITGGDTNRASHHYEVDADKSYIGTDGSWIFISTDTNAELQSYINNAVNEAKNNYNCDGL